MDIHLQPGTYVLAVSGGVDSMALLDMMYRHPQLKLVVAHFDHGIRHDSDLDRELVQQVAAGHGLPFVYDRGHLPASTSEDAARQARYAFLEQVRTASGAQAIVTAHHEDDVLETAILNMLRGTGRRGLVSLRSRPRIKRPLLDITKPQLVDYAKTRGLQWREDATNSDMRYLRNYVRHVLIPRFPSEARQILLDHIRRIHANHHELERELINHLHMHPSVDQLDRHWFIMLPHAVAKEVMMTWLRRYHIPDITSKTLERLVMAAKTYAPGKTADVDKVYVLQVGKTLLALKPRERYPS